MSACAFRVVFEIILSTCVRYLWYPQYSVCCIPLGSWPVLWQNYYTELPYNRRFFHNHLKWLL